MGFENYLAVLDNSAFKLAAGNTLKFVLVCIPAAAGYFPGGFAAADCLQGITRNFQNLFSCAYGNTGGFDCPFVACDFS